MHGPPAPSRRPVLAPLAPAGSHYPHPGGLHNKLMTETYAGSLRRTLRSAASAGKCRKAVRGKRQLRTRRHVVLAGAVLHPVMRYRSKALLPGLRVIAGDLVVQARTRGSEDVDRLA